MYTFTRKPTMRQALCSAPCEKPLVHWVLCSALWEKPTMCQELHSALGVPDTVLDPQEKPEGEACRAPGTVRCPERAASLHHELGGDG